VMLEINGISALGVNVRLCRRELYPEREGGAQLPAAGRLRAGHQPGAGDMRADRCQ
jgi:hypothetical protein